MNNRILKLTALVLALLTALCVSVGCGKNKEKNDAAQQSSEEKGLVVQRTISPTIDEPVVIEPTPDAPAAPTATASQQGTEPENDPEAPQQVPGNAEAIAYVNAADINVREEASSEANILGTLELNTIVFVTKKDANNGWSEIEYNGRQAFAATYLLNFISNSSDLQYEGKASFNGDDVNIRAASTTDSEVIGKASKGTSVDVFKKDAGHDWTLINYEGKAGFVATHLLNFSE